MIEAMIAIAAFAGAGVASWGIGRWIRNSLNQ